MNGARYPYEPASPAGALVVLAVVAVFVVVMPDPGWRLFVGFAGLGALVWLAGEAMRRRRGVRLEAGQVVVELAVFSRAVPYGDIAGVLTMGADARLGPALAYRKLRRQPGLKPRLGLVSFDVVADEAAFWEALRQRAPADLPFSEAQVLRFLRARRFRRRVFGGLALLSTPVIVVIAAQIAGRLL
jgi:hypothetical protein